MWVGTSPIAQCHMFPNFLSIESLIDCDGMGSEAMWVRALSRVGAEPAGLRITASAVEAESAVHLRRSLVILGGDIFIQSQGHHLYGLRRRLLGHNVRVLVARTRQRSVAWWWWW